MTLKWNEKFNIGHQLIDAQHKELIVNFNEFIEACKTSEGKQSLNKTIDFLESYVAKHFAAEERLMRESDYPEVDAHLALHDEFRSKFQEMKTELNQTGSSTSLTIEMNEFLLRWFIHHIMGVDAKLGLHLGK